MDRFEKMAGKVAAVKGKVILDVPLAMRMLANGQMLSEMKVTFDGKWFGFSVERGPLNEYSDEAKFVYSLGQELGSSGNALKLRNMLKDKWAKGARVSSEVMAARPAIELVEKSGSMFETEKKYMIMFQGKPWGELYFNTRGYVAEHGIPVPSSSESGKVSGLQIGERSLAQYKSEISKANREWARMPSVMAAVKEVTAGAEYAIWGVPKGQTEETLLVAQPNGKPITSILEAKMYAGRLMRKHDVTNVRIQKLDISTPFNWMAASELVKVAESLVASSSLLDFVMKPEELARLEGVVDEQTYDLAVEVYQKLRGDLELSDAQNEAISKLKRCVQRGAGMASDAHRNEIFKAAHALGMRLPSNMF